MSDAGPLVAGIEMGGTKCVCVLASGPEDVREQIRIDTTTPEETLGAIGEVLARWADAPGFGAIGVASFGPLELDFNAPGHGCIGATPKPGWSGADLLAPLRSFGVPIGLDTDVNGAALAEGEWGGARGLDSFIYITVGTGIGVGSIVGGRPVRGLGHSEAGHLRVPRAPGSDWHGACPFHGDCVEGLACGPAIEARAGRPASELPASDPVWGEVVHALAALIHNLVLAVAPRRVLMGGGVMGQAFLLPRIRAAVLESLNGYGVAPTIARDIDAFIAAPELGDRAGPLGAIALARRALAAAGV